MINHPRRNDRYAALLCAAAAALVRLLALGAYKASPFFEPIAGGAHDRSIYIDAIASAAKGNFFPAGAFPYLPLYPWLAGIITSVTGGGLTVLAGFGILCDALTTALVCLFARRLGAQRSLAIAVALMYALYPLAVVYSLLTMPNTLNALGVTMFAFAAHISLEDAARMPRRVAVFGLGLLAGILTLGFAGMLLLAGAAGVLLAVRSKSPLRVALFAIGLAVPLIPVATHNSRAEGRFVLLTTHGGFNYYMGNNEHATGYPLRLFNFRMTARAMLDDAHRYAEREAGHSMTRTESSAWWREQAAIYRRHHPVDAALLTAKKIALFWNARDVDDLRMLEQLRITEPFFRRLPGIPFAVFGVLGLVGIAVARGGRVPRWTLLAGMAGIVAFFITARYRLTLVPLMAVLGAAGACRIGADWRSGRKLTAMIVAPALALVCWPIHVKDQRAVDHYNAAIQLIAAHRNDDAMSSVVSGLAIDNSFDQLHFALGSLRYADGAYASAAEAFHEARRLNPQNAVTVYNLALSLARSGDYCAACDVIDEAVSTGVALDDRAFKMLADLRTACRHESRLNDAIENGNVR